MGDTSMEHPQTVTETRKMAAIERLSSECLLRVFQTCNNKDGDMLWLKLANACRHLREVAISSPSLWNKIEVKFGLDCLLACLQRSANAKLDIIFRVLRPEVPPVPAIIHTLQPHAHRIRKLHIVAEQEPPMTTILSHLTFALPGLEALALFITSDTEPTWNKDHFPFTELPLLRSLELYRVPIPWTSPVLTRLRSLTLAHLRPQYGLTLNTIVDILQRNPTLENLTIKSYDPTILDDLPSNAPTGPVPLPNLREIELKDSPAIIARLLGLLDISAGTSVTLEPILSNYHGLGGTFSAALPHDRSKVPVLANIRDLSLSVDRFNLIIECSTSAPTHASAPAGPAAQAPESFFDSDTFSEEPQDEAALFVDALADLADVFADAPVAALALSGDYDYATKRHWRALLSAFPHLAHLDASGLVGTEPLTPLFQALREPPARTTHGVLCPRLASLGVARGWANTETKSVGVLHKTLAHRAAQGARLRELALFVAPQSLLNARWLEKLRAVADEVTMEEQGGVRPRKILRI